MRRQIPLHCRRLHLALTRHAKDAAHRGHRKRLLRGDERELHSLFFAKKAAAFFRISRSIRSESFSFWSTAFSRSSRASSRSGVSSPWNFAASALRCFLDFLGTTACL